MDNVSAIEMCYDLIISMLKVNAPKDTGFLSIHSIRRAGNKIVIGGEIAPYARFTEENNKSSKGWIDRTIQQAVPIVQSYLQNNMSNKDIEKLISENEKIFVEQIEGLADKQKQKLSEIK